MYHAALGQFLTRDPWPQAAEPVALPDNSWFGAWLGVMANRYGYGSANPLNRVDPHGLKACALNLLAGHHLPRTDPDYDRLDEIGHQLDDLEDSLEETGPPPCGTYYGGVGCYPAELQARIGQSFPGRGIPGIRPFGGQNDRLLVVEHAPQILAQAFRAALEFAKTLCRDKDRCCDEVTIMVHCTPDMSAAVAQHGKGEQRQLCDQAPRHVGFFPNRIPCKGP